MLQALVSVLLFDACSSKPVHAVLGLRRKSQPQSPASAESIVELSIPIVKNLGFSSIVGFATGVAFKTVGRSLATLLGAAFVTIQLGAFLGYVTVDWSRVHKDIIRFFDLDKNGTVDVSDFKVVAANCIAVLSQGLPSGGGFCMGLGWGLSM